VSIGPALVADVRDGALLQPRSRSYAQGTQPAGAPATRDKKLGPRSRRDRAHLEGRLHHPRALPAASIQEAYVRDPKLDNLLLDPTFRDELAPRQGGMRRVVAKAAEVGLPLLGMGASLGYYDMVRRERLPANLTQAQRDYFGAHTYKRVDREGDFHTDWRTS
jgi:6-phosphogluconate dehydrogenase